MLQQLQARIGTVSEREIPRAQPRGRWSIRHTRDAAILRAYIEGGHTQTAIAQKTGLSVSRVSRLIAKQETKGKT